MNTPIITIDGPTASGKGTIAQRVASALHFHYLDSGALYRLTALSALRQKVSLEDQTALTRIAAQLPCRFVGDQIWLDNEEVSQAIRDEAIGNAASKIAVYPSVRQALLDLQRHFAKEPGLVADGRDMGTVVFPEAQLKIYLTASVAARAQRRFKQLKEKGISANIDSLSNDLVERDARDQNRMASPLKPAQDAYVLDSSNMTIDEVAHEVLQQYQGGSGRAMRV